LRLESDVGPRLVRVARQEQSFCDSKSRIVDGKRIGH
jgi:hypothetical protein